MQLIHSLLRPRRSPRSHLCCSVLNRVVHTIGPSAGVYQGRRSALHSAHVLYFTTPIVENKTADVWSCAHCFDQKRKNSRGWSCTQCKFVLCSSCFRQSELKGDEATTVAAPAVASAATRPNQSMLEENENEHKEPAPPRANRLKRSASSPLQGVCTTVAERDGSAAGDRHKVKRRNNSSPRPQQVCSVIFGLLVCPCLRLSCAGGHAFVSLVK
jgi:hypothetical protein